MELNNSRTFTIISLATGAGIGCGPAEEGIPKANRVIVLQGGIQFPKWEIEKPGSPHDPRFIMRIDGKYLVVIDKLVYAVDGGIEPALWKIERALSVAHAYEGYVISQVETQYEGWTIPSEDDEETQIIIEPLVAAPSIPPQFIPTQVFEIIPAN